MTKATQVRDTLRAVREILATDATFATGAYARDAAGEPVDPLSPLAVAWCPDGAVRKVLGAYSYAARIPVMDTLRNVTGRAICEIADVGGYTAVLAVLSEVLA